MAAKAEQFLCLQFKIGNSVLFSFPLQLTDYDVWLKEV